jgi:hypothetical protein
MKEAKAIEIFEKYIKLDGRSPQKCEELGTEYGYPAHVIKAVVAERFSVVNPKRKRGQSV